MTERARQLWPIYGHMSADQLRKKAREAFHQAATAKSPHTASHLVQEGEAFRVLSELRRRKRFTPEMPPE